MIPGLHRIGMAEYLSLKALSGGLCHTLLSQSPLHARHQLDNPEDDPSNASDVGSAIHAALLEGIDIVTPLDFPDWRAKAAREARDGERSAGRIPLLAHKAQQVTDAVAAIKSQLPKTEIAGCFDDGVAEQTVIWNDGHVSAEWTDYGAEPKGLTSLLCKIRPDWLSKRWHISVKTTEGSARPDAWIRRQLGPSGYDTSLAFYERGLRTTGWDGQSRILVCEQTPPYRIVVVGLAPSRQQYAESRIDRAITTWQQCVASGRWPGYSTQTHFAELEPWAEAEEIAASQPFTEEQMSAGIPA